MVSRVLDAILAFPDGRFLRPHAVGVAGLKRGRSIAESLGIAGHFVFGHSGPVQCLRCDIRIGVVVSYFAKQSLRPREITGRECRLSESELDLRQKLVSRKITLEAVSLHALRVRDDDGRCPLHAESLKALWIVLNMTLDRNVILADEVADPRIRIYLGLQPSTTPSHRSGAEIEKQRLVVLRRQP